MNAPRQAPAELRWAVRWSLDGRTWTEYGPLPRHAAEEERLRLILRRHRKARRLFVRIVPRPPQPAA